MFMHEHGGGGRGSPYGDKIKNVFFSQIEIVLKQKTANNYLLYIFVVTIASFDFHSFPLDLSPIVLLKLIICFLTQVFHWFILMWAIVKTTWFFQTTVGSKWVNPFSPGEIEKYEFSDSSNSTNFKHQ